MWADGAIWHLTGSGQRARDYGIDDYVMMLGEWMTSFPAYAAEVFEWSVIGDIGYASVRSTGGEAPATAEGLVVYRVVDGRIMEGWAMPSDPRFGF